VYVPARLSLQVIAWVLALVADSSIYVTKKQCFFIYKVHLSYNMSLSISREILAMPRIPCLFLTLFTTKVFLFRASMSLIWLVHILSSVNRSHEVPRFLFRGQKKNQKLSTIISKSGCLTGERFSYLEDVNNETLDQVFAKRFSYCHKKGSTTKNKMARIYTYQQHAAFLRLRRPLEPVVTQSISSPSLCGRG